MPGHLGWTSALLQSSGPVQRPKPLPGLRTRGSWRGWGVSLPWVLVPTCGLPRCLCPLGSVLRMLRSGREFGLNSGSEAEVLVESAQERPSPSLSVPSEPSPQQGALTRGLSLVPLTGCWGGVGHRGRKGGETSHRLLIFPREP